MKNQDVSGESYVNENFSHAELERVNASNADFRNSFMVKTQVYFSDFSNANLDDADILYAFFDSTNFQNASLDADLRHSGFNNCDFRGADLGTKIGAYVDGCTFSACDFRGVDLHALYVSNSSIPAVLSRCKFDGKTKMPRKMDGIIITDRFV